MTIARTAGKWSGYVYARARERVMDKCDKCESMARVTVSGYLVPRYLCAFHASELCESIGDTAGAVKFAELIAGDRVSA